MLTTATTPDYHSGYRYPRSGIRGFHVSSCILGVVSVVIEVDPKKLNNYLTLQIYILKWLQSHYYNFCCYYYYWLGGGNRRF